MTNIDDNIKCVLVTVSLLAVISWLQSWYVGHSGSLWDSKSFWPDKQVFAQSSQCFNNIGAFD